MNIVLVLNKVGKRQYGILLFSKNSHNTYVYVHTYVYQENNMQCHVLRLTSNLVSRYFQRIYIPYIRTYGTYVCRHNVLQSQVCDFIILRECITILSLERVIKYEKSSRYRRFQYFSPALSGIRTVRYQYRHNLVQCSVSFVEFFNKLLKSNFY